MKAIAKSFSFVEDKFGLLVNRLNVGDFHKDNACKI